MCPEVGCVLADVLAATANQGKDGVAKGAPERASRNATVDLHVADFGFDGTPLAQVGDELQRRAASCAFDQHAGSALDMTATARVDDGEAGGLVGQDRKLMLKDDLAGEVLVARFRIQLATTVSYEKRWACARYSSFATSRGGVAGRPVVDGIFPAQSRSNTSRSIRVVNFARSWRRSIMSTGRLVCLREICAEGRATCPPTDHQVESGLSHVEKIYRIKCVERFFLLRRVCGAPFGAMGTRWRDRAVAGRT